MRAVWAHGLIGATLLAGSEARSQQGPPLPPPRPPDLMAPAPVPLPPPRPRSAASPSEPVPTQPGAHGEIYGPVRPPGADPADRAVAGAAEGPAGTEPPLPPARPPDLGALPAADTRTATPDSMGPFRPPASAATAAPAPPPPSFGPTPDEQLACQRLFASGKVVARPLPPVAPTPEGCAMPAPTEVTGVIVSPTRTVLFEPPVTMNCALADAVADWVRRDLVPAFAPPLAPLAAMTSTSGYACRGRNHVAGAKLSEHGRGNAMDIGGLRAADGTRIDVRQAASPLLGVLKATACARFATVLGPGSDGFHESHLHVDLEPRRHGSTICHWDMPKANPP